MKVASIALKKIITPAIIAVSLLSVTLPTAVYAKSGSTITSTVISVNGSSGEFSTLLAAVVAADLAGTLGGNRPYTVFAPTDAAFAKLGLNKDNIATAFDTATLRNILLYHVTNGVRGSQSVVGDKSLRMANGERAIVSGATIDEAKIIQTDIRVGNGVIHVIDSVMLP